MKNYLFTGGLAAFLMLGACGNEVPEASEEVEAEESTNQPENESSVDNSEALEELRTENESLQGRITELEEENEEVELLQERITELEEENDELEEMAAKSAEEEDNTEEDQSESNEDDNAVDESGSTEEGTRSDPMQLGSTAQLDVTINGDDYDDRYEAVVNLTVDDIIIGEEAYGMLVNENPYNDPAPDGYQWALIHSAIELVESETDDYSYYVMDHFEIVEEDGSSAPRESAVTPDSYGGEDIYSGGTSSGYSSVLVPEEGDFLIKYDGFSSNIVFFEID
ncbi:hypothetical protein [Salinicoccus sp. Marseille-QA3877]